MIDKFNPIINEITDYMIEHRIGADRLAGFKCIEDIGAMGTPFHKLVYQKLMLLPQPDRVRALKTLQSLEI